MDNEELYYHKKGDKIKWIVTAVAFLLVFALLIGLCVVVFRPKKEMDQPEQTGEILTNLLAFDNVGQKRTVYSADKQVWEDNGITFTNLKGGGSDIGDFSDPIRLYAHSTVKLECVNMTKIVFYCAGSAYARTLRDSIEAESGDSVEVSGSEVTVIFDPTAKTFEIEDLVGQVQLEQVAVTVIIPPVEAKTANAVDGEGHAMQAGQTYFDIIELTFLRDTTETIIPVVASPIDVVGGISAPIEKDGIAWWKVLVAILAVILLLVLLAPVLPYIIRAVLWVILLPFKAIAALCKAISNSAKKRRRKKEEQQAERPPEA